MSKPQQNPLRISQESIDLDDIISDLNEANQTTKNSVMGSESKQQQQQPSKHNKTATATTTLKSKAQMAKQPSRTGLNQGKENVNKANEQTLAVKGTIIEQKQHKDFLVSTQSETKTERTTNQASTQQDHQEYHRDFNFDLHSSTTEDHSETVSTKAREAPFYMTRGQGSITDEDVEGFQKKLDTLIINFRSETMSEFMRTKKQVLHDQASTIDAERRRCNTLLGVKQNEIEQLKESLASKTKLSEELSLRCEIMALWAGKGKTLARMKVLQFKCFNALKQYRDFKKHSKHVLQNQLHKFKKNQKRRAFLGWEKQYKEWKIVKNKDDFEKAVKQELQHICAQYNKEIESLRHKLDEANTVVDQENRNKAMMQENLKKAFMRGVCALNFEAMNILNPNDMSMQSQIEREMEKQVQFAMNGITGGQTPQYSENRSPQQMIQPRSYAASNMSDHNYSYSQSDLTETYQSERKLLQMDHTSDMDYKKIDTKDSMWKPAPIMGREIVQQTGPTFTYAQPTITSTLRTNQQQQNYVLPSHFNRAEGSQTQSLQREELHIEPVRVDATTDDRVMQNTQIITNASTLPDFITSSLPQVTQQQQPSEGKTIYANGTSQLKSTQAKAGVSVTTQNKKSSVVTGPIKKTK